MDSKTLPADWAETTMTESFHNEVLQILQVLIAKTKTGEIVWEDSQQKDRRTAIIKPCAVEKESEKGKTFETCADGIEVRVTFSSHTECSWRKTDWLRYSILFSTSENEKNVSLERNKPLSGVSCPPLHVLRDAIIEQTESKNYTFKNFQLLNEIKNQILRGGAHEKE